MPRNKLLRGHAKYLALKNHCSTNPRRILKRLWSWGNAARLSVIGILSLLWVTSGAVLADGLNDGYRLGHGYQIKDTGIHLGGYASTKIHGFGTAPWSFEVSDLSLFTTWDNGSNLRLFMELEIEDSLSAGEHRNLTTGSAHLVVERLYLDYLVNDNLTVRIGKILTPVGQWNLIHADPLVWTTTRPVATTNLFSRHANGIMLHGTVPLGEQQSLDYSVYGDYSEGLDPKRAGPPHFDNAVGARLRYNVSDNLKIGLSYADFALLNKPTIRNHLLGFDFAWSYQRFTINSEIVYRNNDAPVNNNAWQGYIQGVSPLAGNLYAVGRYEFFDQDNGQTGQVGVLGLAYRPIPPLVWKLEYRLGERNRDLAPDGLYASFAVLF